MKKIIIGFIVGIFALAFVIGQCNSATNDAAIESSSFYTAPDRECEMDAYNDVACEEPMQENHIINDDIEGFVKLTSAIPNQILVREAYILSYNNKTLCPNWVAWVLTKDHTNGPYSRSGVPYYDSDGNVCGIGRVTSETNKGDYFVDTEANRPRQELNDWPGNEYNMSHGHMCPAGDNKWSKAAINQSFLLTNMCPQHPELNNGDWKILEEKCRKWTNRHGDLYIVAGPIFTNETSRTIGASKIAVPDAFFKVILSVAKELKAIGFIYPNDGNHHSMDFYVHTIDEVEEITGIDFFSCLPDETEREIESRSDLNKW